MYILSVLYFVFTEAEQSKEHEDELKEESSGLTQLIGKEHQF